MECLAKKKIFGRKSLDTVPLSSLLRYLSRTVLQPSNVCVGGACLFVFPAHNILPPHYIFLLLDIAL